MDTRGKSLLIKVTTGFALGGGLGIPALFLILWQVLRRAFEGDALINVMVWVEAFRVMLWPSVMLLVFRAPGDESGQWMDLLVAVVVNVVLYALIGLCIGLALRYRLAQTAVLALLVAGMYGLNAYWSEHLGSFFIAATLLGLALVAFFWKFGANSRQAVN